MRGRPILPALDGLQGSLAVTGLTLHSAADFPPSCGKLFTTHSAMLGSFHWAGRTAFRMREPGFFCEIFSSSSSLRIFFRSLQWTHLTLYFNYHALAIL